MDVYKEVGQKIREIRLERKLSLKEFSEKTGLSVSFLSMMERGLTSVAIATLKKITDSLEYDMSKLFQGAVHNGESDKNYTHVINRSHDQQVNYQNGKYVYFSLSDSNPDHIIDPMIIMILPGQKREEVVQMRHEGEEFAYVLEGMMSLFINDQEYELYPGDSFLGPGDAPHNFVNLTKNIVRILYVLTPPLLYNE